MLFNLLLGNHGKVSQIEPLSRMIEHLSGTLSRNGHDVIIDYAQLRADAINLFFDCFKQPGLADEIAERIRSNNLRSGLVATELLLDGDVHSIPHPDGREKHTDMRVLRMDGFSKMARTVDFVWSYLERTSVEARKLCKVSETLLFGHVPHVFSAVKSAPKDFDVLFFGASTTHRNAILENMAKHGLKVNVVGLGFAGGIWPSPMLNSLMSRSKIGLNLTIYGPGDNPRFDTRFASCIRIVEMLEHQMCVVSEDIPQDNPYRPYIRSAPVNELGAVCKHLIDSGAWAQLGPTRSAAFRAEMDAVKICGPVIDRTLRAIGAVR